MLTSIREIRIENNFVQKMLSLSDLVIDPELKVFFKFENIVFFLYITRYPVPEF